MTTRARLGVSPIIATLLLVVIAVAGAVITYAFVSGMVSVNQPSALTNKVSIDQVSSDGTTVTIYARNTGSAPVGIDHVYVEGRGGVVDIPMSEVVVIPAGGTSPILLPDTFSDGTYVFKLASAQGVLYAQSHHIGGGDPTPTPPGSAVIITLNSPLAGTYGLSTPVINATTTSINSTISNVVAVLDGSTNVNLALSDGFYVGTTPPLSDGAHTIYITALDALGTSNSTSPSSFAVDLLPPSASFNSPMNASYAGPYVPINVSVTDMAGISMVVAEVNGSFNVTLALQSGFYVNTTAMNFGTGKSFVKIFANDTLGHAGANAGIYFTVLPPDTTPPTCFSIEANTTTTEEPCLFSSTWGDNVALSGYVFSTNLTGAWANSSWSAFSGSVGSAVMALPSGGTVVGYRFYANDTSDNWGDSGVGYLTTGEYVWVSENTTVVTGYADPTAAPSGVWASASYAYSDGIDYASSTGVGTAQQYSDYGFALPSNTTRIDSVIIRYDAWAYMPTYTEAYSIIALPGIGWQTYNITSALGIPKGAIAEIIMLNGNNAATSTLGVRTGGSSLNRYVKLHEAEGGGNVTVNMLVKVSEATGEIQTYCSSMTGVTFILVGYWTGVDFTETMHTWTAGTENAWTDYNLTSAAGVPASRVAQIYCGNRNDGGATTLGVRAVGSGMNRHMSVHEAESASTEYTDYEGYTSYTKTDGSGLIQYFSSSTSYGDFVCLGFFSPGMDYTELWTQKNQASNGWVDWDLTSDLDQDGRVVNFVLGNVNNGNEYGFGARADGSSLARVIVTHESEANTYASSSMCVKSDDATGIVELYTAHRSREYFMLAGYFMPPIPKIRVDASYDGGANWVTYQETTLTASETTYTYDVAGLRAWTFSELSGGNFVVRAIAVTATTTYLDWAPVNVTYAYDSSHWEYT